MVDFDCGHSESTDPFRGYTQGQGGMTEGLDRTIGEGKKNGSETGRNARLGFGRKVLNVQIGDGGRCRCC